MKLKCIECELKTKKPNPTFVYVKCKHCGELIDVRKKPPASTFFLLKEAAKAMQKLARS